LQSAPVCSTSGIQVEQGEVGAATGQVQRSRATNSASGSGHYDGLVANVHSCLRWGKNRRRWGVGAGQGFRPLFSGDTRKHRARLVIRFAPAQVQLYADCMHCKYNF